MKALPSALLASAVLLSGCAGSGQHAVSNQDAVHWWNPLSYSWSSALPWNWFGSSLQVTEQGVGNVTHLTPFTTEAIGKAIGSDYRLRQGMGTRDGQIVSYIEAMKDKQVAMTFYGDSSVQQINIKDPKIVSLQGVKLGSPFAQTYQKAFGACQAGQDSQHVRCRAPNSQHIDYIYQGEFNGPSGLMPADETLKQWTVSQIDWHA